MLNAEKFASLASLYGRPYPQDGMELTWKNLLFDHFHDIMPGSGIAVNYLDAKRNLEDVDRAANDVTHGIAARDRSAREYARRGRAGNDFQFPVVAAHRSD